MTTQYAASQLQCPDDITAASMAQRPNGGGLGEKTDTENGSRLDAGGQIASHTLPIHSHSRLARGPDHSAGANATAPLLITSLLFSEHSPYVRRGQLLLAHLVLLRLGRDCGSTRFSLPLTGLPLMVITVL